MPALPGRLPKNCIDLPEPGFGRQQRKGAKASVTNSFAMRDPQPSMNPRAMPVYSHRVSPINWMQLPLDLVVVCFVGCVCVAATGV